MKKICAVFLLLLLSASQVLACGGGPEYLGERCSEYTWSYSDPTMSEEEKRILPYRSEVSKILTEKFDLTKKSDYEQFLKLKSKVISYIDSQKYSGKYKDVLCAIHLEIDTRSIGYYGGGYPTSKNEVLVEEVGVNGLVDLYVISINTGISKKIYSEVEKIEYTANTVDETRYQEHLETKYPDARFLFIHNMGKIGDTDLVSFTLYRDGKTFGAIEAYNNEAQEFRAYGKELTFPNGDTDTYKPAYVIDSDTLLVKGSSCGTLMTGILKNGASKVESIINTEEK